MPATTPTLPRPPRHQKPLRRSLRSSALEGVFAEVVGACAGGGVLTAWALYLDLPPALIGLLGALPSTAQLVHLPAAWISRRFGSRRTALFAIAASRQGLLPLVALPFLPLSPEARQAIFLSVAFGSAALGMIGNNAWTAWMSELVPAAVRGRYFGRRSALCALAATCSSLVAGVWLDRARGTSHAGLALSLLAAVSCAAGAVTVLLLRRQHEPEGAPPQGSPRLREALAPLRDGIARRLLAFQLAWSFASGIAAAFYPLHMIGNLRMGFARMALYSAGLAVCRMLAAPLWGRALDRVGARPVLIACSFALSVSPVLWLFPAEGRLWPLALDALLCGTAMGGYSLAAFSLPISLSGPRGRSFLLATFAAAGGLATGAASAFGGFLVEMLPADARLAGQPVVCAQLLFLCGGAARLFAALLAVRIVEPAARPVRELGRLALARVRPAWTRAVAPERAKLSA